MMLRRNRERQRAEQPVDVLIEEIEQSVETGGEPQTGADPETLTGETVQPAKPTTTSRRGKRK